MGEYPLRFRHEMRSLSGDTTSYACGRERALNNGDAPVFQVKRGMAQQVKCVQALSIYLLQDSSRRRHTFALE